MIPKPVRSILQCSLVLYAALAVLFAVTVDFKKAAKQRTRYLLGVFYNQELNNYTDGIVYFDYLSRLRPNDGRNYFFLGYCYLYLQQYDKALNYLNRALQSAPGEPVYDQYVLYVNSKLKKDGKEVPLPSGVFAIPTE